VKKLRTLVNAFEAFEKISLTPGSGDITLVELQVGQSLIKTANSERTHTYPVIALSHLVDTSTYHVFIVSDGEEKALPLKLLAPSRIGYKSRGGRKRRYKPLSTDSRKLSRRTIFYRYPSPTLLGITSGS
jgi:hypothetical protein